MKKTCLAALLLLLLTGCLALQPLAAGYERLQADIPLDPFLDRLNYSKSVHLLRFEQGGYTLALTKSSGDAAWIRAVLEIEDYYYAACVLGLEEDLLAQKELRVEISRKEGSGKLSFLTLEGDTLASAILPLDLSGEVVCSGFAETQGVSLTEASAAAAAQPAGEEEQDAFFPEEEAGFGDEKEVLQSTTSKVSLRYYLTALCLLLILMILLVLLQLYSMRIKLLWKALFGKKTSPVKKLKAPSPPAPTAEEERIVLPSQEPPPREAPSAAPAAQESPLAQMNFTTVSLRNREALRQIEDESLRPLFAPNAKGQIFSLEEESGSIYLHVEYFSQTNFMVHPVLRSVCLERVFALQDETGYLLSLNEALGRPIIEMAPAQTIRTDDGYLLTEKGRLIIGEE